MAFQEQTKNKVSTNRSLLVTPDNERILVGENETDVLVLTEFDDGWDNQNKN